MLVSKVPLSLSACVNVFNNYGNFRSMAFTVSLLPPAFFPPPSFILLNPSSLPPIAPHPFVPQKFVLKKIMPAHESHLTLVIETKLIY